jgi:hypothetical protein
MALHGLEADLNLYAYVHGAVFRAVDPLGLDANGAEGSNPGTNCGAACDAPPAAAQPTATQHLPDLPDQVITADLPQTKPTVPEPSASTAVTKSPSAQFLGGLAEGSALAKVPGGAAWGALAQPSSPSEALGRGLAELGWGAVEYMAGKMAEAAGPRIGLAITATAPADGPVGPAVGLAVGGAVTTAGALVEKLAIVNIGTGITHIAQAVLMSVGGRGGDSSAGEKPAYKANPAHTAGANPRKTPEPRDAAAAYERAIAGADGHWYAKGENGQIYRYFNDNAGGAHFSGMTGEGGIPLDRIPIAVRRSYGMVR